METIQKLTDKAGIIIGEDVKVHDDEVYSRVIRDGSLGLGETYMSGKWDAENLDDVFYKIGRANLSSQDISWWDTLNLVYQWTKAFIWNPQSIEKSKEVAEKHYNLSNDFYSKMLDSRTIYSCAYWKNANTLEEAQTAKCQLICDKLKLKHGMTVLDIGCGFGGLSSYMAEHYQVKAVAITNSREQYNYAKQITSTDLVEYRLCDYRNLRNTDDKFDAIVSVGMFEHVGPSNYQEFFEIVRDLLSDNGIFLLHTIGGNKSKTTGDRWITKYIFPNSVLPSLSQIAQASENIFVTEDVHNFGPDYDKTLMAWYHRFDDTYNGDKNSEFYRMWKYYLLSSAGIFRARHIQLYQVIFTKRKLGCYECAR